MLRVFSEILFLVVKKLYILYRLVYLSVGLHSMCRHNFGSENIFGLKKTLGLKDFGPQKNYGHKKTERLKKILGPKIFGQKKFWVPKKI